MDKWFTEIRDSVHEWVVRNLTVVNLVLVVFSIMSYMATMYSIAFYTHWVGLMGEIGGVLDYRVFGQSAIYHVTKENLRGELLFSFPDVTSYFLTAIIVFNLATLFNRQSSDITVTGGIQIEEFAMLNLIIAVLCMVFYVRTMMFIDSFLKHDPDSIGGVVTYGFPLAMGITHVYQGHVESSINSGPVYDLTSWLLLLLLALTVVTIARQLGSD